MMSDATKKRQGVARKTLASPGSTPRPRAASVTPSILIRAPPTAKAFTPSKQPGGGTSSSSFRERVEEEESDHDGDASEHGSEINIIEQIVGKRTTRSSGTLYRVKWLGGTSEEDNSWESEDSIVKKHKCRHLIDAYERDQTTDAIGNQQSPVSSPASSPLHRTATNGSNRTAAPSASNRAVIESDSSTTAYSPSPEPREMAPKAKQPEKAVKGQRFPTPASRKKTASTASTVPAGDEDDEQLVGYDNVYDEDDDAGRDDREEAADTGADPAETVYEVEKILDKSFDKRKRPLYLVKWKGWEEKTWEPKSSFKTCDAMLQNFEEKIKNMKQKPLAGTSSSARSRSRAHSVVPTPRMMVSSTPKTTPTARPGLIMPPPSAASRKATPAAANQSSTARQQPTRKSSVGGDFNGGDGIGDAMALSQEPPAPRMSLGVRGSIGEPNLRGHDFTATVAKLGPTSNKRVRSASVTPAVRSIGGATPLATMGARLSPSAPKKARKEMDGQSTSSNGGGCSHEPSPPSATNSSDAGTTAPVRTLDLLNGSTIVLTDTLRIEGVVKVVRGAGTSSEPIATVLFSDGSKKLVGSAHLSTRAPEKLIEYYEDYLHLFP